MFRKSAKRTSPSKRLALLALSCLVGSAAAGKPANRDAGKPKEAAVGAELIAPAGGALTVSDKELNTFVFPAAVKRIFFPAGSPVVGDPIYLANGTQVMLQFAKGADTSVQMVVELADSAVHTLRVLPRPVQGVTHNVAGARAAKAVPRSMKAQGPQKADARAEDIALLKKIVVGDVPEDFVSVELPRPTRFDKFTVIPMAGWSDSANRRAYVFSLVANAGQVALVAAPQFYRPGITAVMLDGDVVDEKTSPMLYVLEEVSDE